jgi:hypothetical protein
MLLQHLLPRHFVTRLPGIPALLQQLLTALVALLLQ